MYICLVDLDKVFDSYKKGNGMSNEEKYTKIFGKSRNVSI